MSTATLEVDDDSPVHPGEHHDHGPTDRQYFNIFFILVALTALEVSTYWWEDWFGDSAHKAAVPLLLVLMLIKFFMVALYFMHLKWDAPMLKRIFYAGAVVAVVVYVVALSSMNFWQVSGTQQFNDPPPVPPPPFCTGSDCPS